MSAFTILLLTLLLIIIYYLSTKNFNYWKKKQVPYASPVPLFGNYADYILLKKYYAIITKQLCERFPKEPYFGTFFGTEPALVVLDPEMIKIVFTKDFYYFNSREIMDHYMNEVITQTLFFSHGDRWKVVRQNLTPLFSTARMKKMFYLVEKCAAMFEDMLDHETGMSNVVGVKTLMIRYTMDCICSCVFGIDGHTQSKDAEKNPFTIMGQLIFGTSYYRGFKTMFRAIWPQVFYGLGMKSFPSEINDFFHKLLTGVFESRQYKPSPRNDFVDLLLSFKANEHLVGDSITNLKTGESKKIKLEVDNELLVSRCIQLFGAGFETSANTLSLTMYELAKNQEVQRLAHQEINEYLRRHNNKLDYDCVKELPFLHACVSETLRRYPILGTLTREVVEDYTFPCGLKLEKGIRIHLPVYHIHHDPANFPEPLEYKPERFLSENNEIKPYTYFPFGEGARYCIGSRFAKMQMIPGLITFLKKYQVELADDTPDSLEFESTTIPMKPTGPLNLKVTPRSGWEERTYVR